MYDIRDELPIWIPMYDIGIHLPIWIDMTVIYPAHIDPTNR